MAWAWFSVFLGALFKAVILKYGGIGAYRNFRPFFLGLILGQLSCGSFWMIVDWIAGTTGNYLPVGVH